jgi:hypothetical protein
VIFICDASGSRREHSRGIPLFFPSAARSSKKMKVAAKVKTEFMKAFLVFRIGYELNSACGGKAAFCRLGRTLVHGRRYFATGMGVRSENRAVLPTQSTRAVKNSRRYLYGNRNNVRDFRSISGKAVRSSPSTNSRSNKKKTSDPWPGVGRLLDQIKRRLAIRQDATEFAVQVGVLRR